MTADPDETRTAIQTALEALKRGDRVTARRLAEQAASLAPESEEPWLILAALAGPAESLAFIQKALQIDPQSKPAQHALEWALERQRAQTIAPEPEPPAEQIHPPTSPVFPAEPPMSEFPPSSPASGRKKTPSSPIRTTLYWLLGLAVLALITGLSFLRPQLTGLVARLFSEDGCSQSLVLGTRSFEIRTIELKEDGTLDIPRNHPERAYWVEGTTTNLVFGLSPLPDNLTLFSTLKSGDTATVTWANCNTATYNLSAPQSDVPETSTLLDQSTSQITIFVPGEIASGGTMVQGELQEETITTFNTPDASALQAEISLLETTTSTDGSTITVSVSIYNFGGTAFTLSASDVSLTPENASPVAPLNSEPALPKEIEPGTTEAISFTFSRPSSTSATLKIFSVEYELEGY